MLQPSSRICLTVKRIGLSYVIQISFESLDPKRAADIADAVANEYIVGQLQAKFQSARLAGSWLRDRLKGTARAGLDSRARCGRVQSSK